MENKRGPADPTPGKTSNADKPPETAGVAVASGDPLTPQQRIAVSMLAEGQSKTLVAAMLGVDRSTVHRWLNQPLFLATVNEAVAEFRRTAAARLQSLTEHAIDAIEGLLETAKGPVRLAAAKTVIEWAGLNVPRPIGSTDPEEIRQQQEDIRMQEEERAFSRKKQKDSLNWSRTSHEQFAASMRESDRRMAELEKRRQELLNGR